MLINKRAWDSSASVWRGNNRTSKSGNPSLALAFISFWSPLLFSEQNTVPIIVFGLLRLIPPRPQGFSQPSPLVASTDLVDDFVVGLFGRPNTRVDGLVVSSETIIPGTATECAGITLNYSQRSYGRVGLPTFVSAHCTRDRFWCILFGYQSTS